MIKDLTAESFKLWGEGKASGSRDFVLSEAAKNVRAGKNIGKTLFENPEVAKILDF